MAELTSDLLHSAREGRRDKVVELLAIYYPIVWRISAGLTGRHDVGKGVTRLLMQRSLRTLPTWKDEGAPTRWFHHHTLLTARRTYRHGPDAFGDTLAPELSNDGAPYVAFIKALRALPMQQREAYILAHGEKLDIRAIAVAMDCSVLAAGNHLHEATDRLRQLDPKSVDLHTLRLQKNYQKLVPDEQLAIKDIRTRVTQHFIPRVVGRILKNALALTLLLTAIWGTWRVWQVVRHSLTP